MSKKIPGSVFDIDRNDVASAVAYYEAVGSITGSEFATLLQLQDDPSELLETSKHWTITEG